MSAFYGYHLTDKALIKSILNNGIVPSIGRNSRRVNEQYFLTYFTTFDNIDTWIKRFCMNRDEVIILKFPFPDDYGRRIDSVDDLFVSRIISSSEITVIDEERELPLLEYYINNMEIIALSEGKLLDGKINYLMERLEKIENASLEPEEVWEYTETEPDLFETIELLKLVKSCTEKRSIVASLDFIKNKSLKKLCENDLMITEDSKIYELISVLFNEALGDECQFDFMEFNIAEVLIGVNLFYRQLNRKVITSKKYGSENINWNLECLSIGDVETIVDSNPYLKAILIENSEIHNKYEPSRLKEFREKNNLTQKQLSKELAAFKPQLVNMKMELE